jgi:hypothetical protein
MQFFINRVNLEFSRLSGPIQGAFMFSVFAAKNSHGALIISVRIDEIGTGMYRSRWNRMTHGWEAMRYQVQARFEQIETIFGSDLSQILLWIVENESPGNWQAHLNRVRAGDQVRVDLDVNPIPRAVEAYSERGWDLAGPTSSSRKAS